MSAKRSFIFGVVATLAAMNLFINQSYYRGRLEDEHTYSTVLDVASIHTNTNAAPSPEEHKTSIILVSNLVPMHPEINVTVDILDSAFKYLEGLLPSTPVYISIDGLSDPESVLVRKHNYAANTESNRVRLQNTLAT